MMMVVPASKQLVREIYPRLRKEDLAEVAALCPTDPRYMLEKSLSMSDGAWVWMVDGQPGAIWGVQAHGDESCALWMLGTDEVPKNGRFIARYSKAIIEDLLKVYRRIEILVDARYQTSLRWLQWLGFCLGKPAAMGPQGQEFYTAIRNREG